MIDNQYYKGFEGYPEYIVRNSEGNGYSVWDGYFSTIMTGGFIEPPKEGGFIYYWNLCIGFEGDDENWKIPNLAQAIFELRSYDKTRKTLEKSSDDMIEDSEKVKDTLLKFLEDAKARNLDVYVQRD